MYEIPCGREFLSGVYCTQGNLCGTCVDIFNSKMAVKEVLVPEEYIGGFGEVPIRDHASEPSKVLIYEENKAKDLAIEIFTDFMNDKERVAKFAIELWNKMEEEGLLDFLKEKDK